MQVVRRGFSRKPYLYASITARGICSVWNTPEPAGITFGKGTVAGICVAVQAYNPIVGI
jgi:hypothetical protein